MAKASAKSTSSNDGGRSSRSRSQSLAKVVQPKKTVNKKQLSSSSQSSKRAKPKVVEVSQVKQAVINADNEVCHFLSMINIL